MELDKSRKTIIFYSNPAWLKTGFGKNAKNILSYLWKTKKYNLISVCGGAHISDPKLQSTPWISVPALPDDLNEMKALERDPRLHSLAVYGNSRINEYVNRFEADIVLAVEDPWSIAFDHTFWNKIPSILWTTLDSTPILPLITENMDKLKNLWIWSNFATKKLHDMGHKEVKTVHGPIDSSKFYKLSDKKRAELRDKNNIPQNAFIISFVFRNQGRKSVDKLIQGYKIFKNQNPDVKNSFLLLHTNFSEGWSIPTLVKEFDVNPNEILCTYICKSCKQYEVKVFSGQDKDCPFCNSKGGAPNQENPHGSGQITITPNLGVTEEQLNEIYNISSIYCHPFNSGGQEIPIQEAKLAELVTLVTEYSCGEEMCEEGSASLPLECTFYKDLNNNMFDKAMTYPSSIAKQIAKCYYMKPEKLIEMGRKSRDWVLKNYSIDTIGKFIEDFIDNQPKSDYKYKEEYILKNSNAQIPAIEDNVEWIKSLYKNILMMEDGGDGIKYWTNVLKEGKNRQAILDYFINVARQENQKNQKIDFSDLLIKNNKKQLAVIQPASIGDLIGILGILESIRSRYSSIEWNIYMITAPQYFEIFEGCEFIDKLLPYQPWMQNNFACEGIGTNQGYFDICYHPFKRPQVTADYTHNGLDIIDLEIK